MTQLITNFINNWSLYMPGNPFVALAVLLLVICGSLMGVIWIFKESK